MSDVNDCYYPVTATSSMFLKLYDAGRVQRFHTTPDYSGTPHQNLAEHSWGVAMLCVELCVRSTVTPSTLLLRAALTHDLAEYWTADLPAHVGWAHPALTEGLNAAQTHEEVAHGIWFADRLTDWDKRVLWWADKLELFLYSLQRARNGVAAYRAVATNIESYLRGKITGEHTFLDNLGLKFIDEFNGALT